MQIEVETHRRLTILAKIRNMTPSELVADLLSKEPENVKKILEEAMQIE